MPEHEEALATSARIAEMVEPHYESLGLGRRCFPSFQPPGSKTPEDYLRDLCELGMSDRYGDDPAREARERLDHELGIINRMGFAGYFLIVWDFVRYRPRAGNPGLARGSACGAIVSYVLNLSHVCPLKYDLLFERFLDPNRSEAPDIDIDLCQERAIRSDRLCPPQVWRRERGPDRHVRHHGRQGRDQGRGPGAEHSAGAGRADHQAGARDAQHHPG